MKVREETGRLSPPQSVTSFRLSSMVIGRRVPEFLGLLRVIDNISMYNTELFLHKLNTIQTLSPISSVQESCTFFV